MIGWDDGASVSNEVDQFYPLTIIRVMKKQPTKKITIEKLVQMSQVEFVTIRSEMKQGFSEVKEVMLEMQQTMLGMQETMKMGFERMATKEDLREEVQKINYAHEIDTLRDRVKRLEEKVGIRK